jgi:putative copper export protein/methionine-rich copper-binding protein CopC
MRVPNTLRIRCLALACAAVAVAVVTVPTVLFAHARLMRSIPAANGRLENPPIELRLWFSERPELRFTSIQLVDSAGRSIALGAVAQGGSDRTGIVVPIAEPVAAGRYTVVWRTAAADGHATNGRFAFTVAVGPSAVPHPAVPSTIPGTAARGATRPGTGALAPNTVVDSGTAVMYSAPLRWAELMSVLTLIGAVLFRLFILQPAELAAPVIAESADRARRLAHAALALFVLATLTRVVDQSNLIAGAAGARIPAVMSVIEGTRWGHGWLVGLLGAALALIGLAVARSTSSGWIVGGVGVAAIATSESLTGHAGAATHLMPLAVGVDVAHVLGAGGWLGGLTAVLLSGLPALRSLDDVERPRAGSRLVRSFHHAAVQCVALVVATAAIAAWLRLGAVDALWTTSYGRILMLKIALVVVLLMFGWYHRRTAVVPEWEGGTKSRFLRSAVGELLVGALVLAVTAVLVGTALPTQ